MKVFFRVFLLIMGIINILAGFLINQPMNVIVGTICLVMMMIYKKIGK